MRILGREPVYILAFVAVALKLSSAYGLEVTADQQAVIMAVLSGVVALVEAIVLRTGAAAAAVVNLAQACLALFLGFGLDMTAEQQALWMLAVEGAIAIFLRREVTAPVQVLSIEQTSPLDRTHTTRAA
ncbi:hypothetical protein [Streptomyces caniscabiei]|uniref:Integral membrane protein n=1 Tax=Streptomyces caniscabiei TaxID=2746961 RepID=A0ABU4MZK8_9ACTN|nr:hypothetical protein [Streptomyces caniscabiei]MBE4790340.1 hypothetical protein [Streptomyces caniscabiei]MBE4799557.1 hypothetical protein [Streptomyces caniscabiei]MDX3015198.1 hypothetical protein [Streptomyces caniscabiei]MDX3042641.1 hypothetical protein [Streptomyces caniscabiei]